MPSVRVLGSFRFSLSGAIVMLRQSQAAFSAFLWMDPPLILPWVPWGRPLPKNIAEILLNASPILLHSCCLRSRSLGQSTRTWTTVSLAEHSHLSSPLKPFALAHVANHECPVLSCARRYARFLGSVSQSRCARFDVSQSSVLHNTGNL
jgi:hypothetical protein